MGEGDVVMWLNKLKPQKIEDIETLIPMYLEESALAVYLEMEVRDQADAENIEYRLKTAFSEGAFDWGTSGHVCSGNKVTSRIGRIHRTKPREDCQNGLRVWFSWPHLNGTEIIDRDWKHGGRGSFEVCQSAGKTDQWTGDSCNLYQKQAWRRGTDREEAKS